jgi:DNA replication and repair protein RecF
MFLRKLHVHNFRNYSDALIEFNPSINAFYGDNAQGKTNLLEAIYFLIVGRSFRTPHIDELVKNGSPGFFLEAYFIKHGVEHRLKVIYNGKEKKVVFNNTTCPSITALLGLLSGVVIIPNDDLIKGSPSSRRLFLDLLIAQTDPLYIYHSTRYSKAMQQRNSMLKQKRLSGIEAFEHELANSGAYIMAQRTKTINDMQELLPDLYSNLSGESNYLKLVYKGREHKTESEYKNDLIKLYEYLRSREMHLGMTLAGPHRDEMQIVLGEQEMRYFGSEGQQRTCVAAMRLAGWLRLKNVLGEAPLTLIDDIGISLDKRRLQRMMDYLATLGQVFVTSTEAWQNNTVGSFHVNQGIIEAYDEAKQQ